ncbi:hypothetical protein KCP76_20720 [Salmonella enterica subsp. enterica serovar Weltevreden]|nr:hypothetical protein KCP76_20720 [Salmonella enterica subsp. enterica serovar Weltevreden]
MIIEHGRCPGPVIFTGVKHEDRAGTPGRSKLDAKCDNAADISTSASAGVAACHTIAA